MPIANVNGINIYYEVRGQGDPLVLIQGFGMGHEGWFAQASTFKEHFKVIIFDNRGIGRSDRSPGPYTVKTMADDTISLMDYLGVDKAHILGMSLGGIVAQEMAINHPEKVNKLLLVCTSTGEGWISDIHPKLLKAMGINKGSSQLDLKSIDFEKLLHATTSLAFNNKLYSTLFSSVSKYYVKRAGILGHLEQIEAVTGQSTRHRLHFIKAPTLVITGTEDRIVPPRYSDEIARLIPNAKLVKVSGASHLFPIEMSSRFNREVLNFLRI